MAAKLYVASCRDPFGTDRHDDAGGKPPRCTASCQHPTWDFCSAGFWWTLDRELSFKVEDRHFQLGIRLLLVGMVMLAVFGVLLPLRSMAYANPSLMLDYHGIVLALIIIFGSMLTEMGHYGLFKLPKYGTGPEKVVFVATLLVIAGLVLKWYLL